nr:mitochondrial cardiolipin hydrolase isoform X2 [Pongo pygmaeus]
MGRLRWQVAAAAAVGLALALEALPWVLRWLRSRRRRPRREVLFFPSQVTCTEALLRAPGAALVGLPEGCPCGLPHGESALSRLLRALLSARASLELCLFAFSSPQLGRAVQLLHQRGVRVRVVTDCDYMALNGSQIGLLRKAGTQKVTPARATVGSDNSGGRSDRETCGALGIVQAGQWSPPRCSFCTAVASC